MRDEYHTFAILEGCKTHFCPLYTMKLSTFYYRIKMENQTFCLTFFCLGFQGSRTGARFHPLLRPGTVC
jgi:hypothetical protein